LLPGWSEQQGWDCSFAALLARKGHLVASRVPWPRSSPGGSGRVRLRDCLVVFLGQVFVQLAVDDVGQAAFDAAEGFPLRFPSARLRR
jgi:hypothetical protein